MFQQKPEDRLRSWREFRATIESLPIEQALVQTAEFWTRAPFAPYNLDPADPKNWPDPWTLIYENYYCDIAKVLGIVYTIALTSHKNEATVEIRVYKDPISRHEYNLAWINQGKYIINMIDEEILNIKEFNKALKLKQQFTAVDLKLDYYNN